MRDFLARRWFLLLLAGGIGLALLRPEWLRPGVGWFPLRGAVALSLFLMAWSLEGRRVWLALLRPAPALWALVVSYGAMPALALALGPLLPSPDLRLGLLIIVSVPCTLSSAVLWTRLAGGNEALALLITVSTTGLGWLMTTAWLTLATGVSAGPDAGEMMRGLAVVLVVPVALGQGVRLIPGVSALVLRHRAANGVAVRLLVTLVVLRGVVDATGSTLGLTAPALVATGVVCLGLHLAGVGLGLGGGRVLGFARGDCIAIGFGGSQKTLPVGLFLLGTYYGAEHPLAVVPMLFYHVGQLVLDTFIADALAGRAPAGREEVGP